MLKELRKSRGLSRKELANKTNLTQQAIFNYENNKRYPDFNKFEKLCNVLELNQKQRVMLMSSFAENKKKN